MECPAPLRHCLNRTESVERVAILGARLLEGEHGIILEARSASTRRMALCAASCLETPAALPSVRGPARPRSRYATSWPCGQMVSLWYHMASGLTSFSRVSPDKLGAWIIPPGSTTTRSSRGRPSGSEWSTREWRRIADPTVDAHPGVSDAVLAHLRPGLEELGFEVESGKGRQPEGQTDGAVRRERSSRGQIRHRRLQRLPAAWPSRSRLAAAPRTTRTTGTGATSLILDAQFLVLILPFAYRSTAEGCGATRLCELPRPTGRDLLVTPLVLPFEGPADRVLDKGGAGQIADGL